MRAFLVALLLLPLASLAQTTTPDPLTVILPSGRTLHFESADAKAKFLAAQERQRQVQASQPTPTPHTPATMGTTLLDSGETTSAGVGTPHASALDQPSQSRIPINGKVMQVTEDGIRVANSTGKDVMVVGYPSLEKVAEGDGCHFIASDSGTTVYTTVTGAKRQIAKYTYVSGHVEK